MGDVPALLVASVLDATYYLREHPLIQRMLLKQCNPIWFCPTHLTIRGSARIISKTSPRLRDYVIKCDLTDITIHPIQQPKFSWLSTSIPCVYSSDCIYSNMILSLLLEAVDSDFLLFMESAAYAQLDVTHKKVEVLPTPEYMEGRLSLFVDRLKEKKGELVIV